jgi:hypothetical protein
MFTLSGRLGVGVIVPAIVYDATPDSAVPAVGLENVIEPVAAAAANGESTRASKRGIARNWSFMIVSPK